MTSRPSEGDREDLHSLRLYLDQAAQTPLLTPEEEKALAAQIRQGHAAQAALLTSAKKILMQRLQQGPVRKAIRDLRSFVSPSMLGRALQLIPLHVLHGFGTELTDKTLLETCIDIAGKKIQVRHLQTLDSEKREAQETLLGITRFTEDVLLRLANRFILRSERTEWEKQESLTSHGETARDHLGKSNVLLVVSIAKRGRYRWGDLPLLDRIQEGNVGLMRAVDGFDPCNFGTRFSTYATPWISQAIDRALMNQTGAIRRPVHVHEMVCRFRKSLQGIASEHGQGIRLEEEMEELQLNDRVRATIRLSARSQDVRSIFFDDGEECRHEHRIVDEAETAADARESVRIFRDRVRSLLKVLTEREAHIVTLRLGLDGSEPKIQRQIGELFGITRARAQQIEVRALAKLQAAVRRSSVGITMVEPAHSDKPRGKLTHGSYAALFQSLALLPIHRNQNTRATTHGTRNGVQAASFGQGHV